MLLNSTADSRDRQRNSDTSKKSCIKAKSFKSERVHMCMESGIKNLPETHLKILSKQVTFLKFLGDYSPKIQLSCSSSCYCHGTMEAEELRK